MSRVDWWYWGNPQNVGPLRHSSKFKIHPPITHKPHRYLSCIFMSRIPNNILLRNMNSEKFKYVVFQKSKNFYNTITIEMVKKTIFFFHTHKYRHNILFQVPSVSSSGEIARRFSYTNRNMGVAHLSKIKMCLSSFHTEPNTPRSRKGFHGWAQVSFGRMSAVSACKLYALYYAPQAGCALYRAYTARYADESYVYSYLYTGNE